MLITADTLNSIMEFDHVIYVHEDGSLSEPPNVWAPELHAVSDLDGQHTAQTDPDLHMQARMQGWTLLTGWSGQFRYSGPCMHQSEYVGGRLAEHVLSTPGFWVVVVVTEDDDEASSWAIAHRESAEVGGHRWHLSPMTSTRTCEVCGLLPLDEDDALSDCYGRTLA